MNSFQCLIIAFQPRDCRFNEIPREHENRARVARPFLPRAGDAIHPALQKRAGSGFETNPQLSRASTLRKRTFRVYISRI